MAPSWGVGGTSEGGRDRIEPITKADLQREALELPEQERLALASELWASVEDPNSVAQNLELPQWQKDLIDERLESSKDDPGQPWAEVRAEIWPNS